MRKLASSLLFLMVCYFSANASAVVENYVIDAKNAHASIQFRIKHLGYSWLTGRFDTFSGNFKLDRDNPEKSSVEVQIDPASINSNHAERDRHLRDERFLHTDKFKTATFKSTRIELTSDKTGVIYGDLTLHGITKEIAINAQLVGGGDDPWGGFRVGFVGTTKLSLADFGITYNLGPESKEVELTLNVEGIRQ